MAIDRKSDLLYNQLNEHVLNKIVATYPRVTFTNCALNEGEVLKGAVMPEVLGHAHK